MFGFVKKIFGDRHQREIKRVSPIVEEINRIYATLAEKSDAELKERVQEIKLAIKDKLAPLEKQVEETHKAYVLEHSEGKKESISAELDSNIDELKKETQNILNDFLPEVFAIVKDTCRRLIGYEYSVRGNSMIWNMVPFDVQLIGGINLHEGKIAEMATGEGKTLVATLPLFLNALTGRGCHLITVNDYLAQRDSEWMSPIFFFHELTIGVIYSNMDNNERQRAYQCDITYGTNSEFGFDYLRDNMVINSSHLVQRKLFYAIVDEVDSVLIDEARTPLIISGPVGESKNFYNELLPYIRGLVNSQGALVKRLTQDAKELFESENPNWEELGTKLLTIKRAAPRSKGFLKLMKEGELKKLVNDMEGVYLRDKKMHTIDNQLFYYVDERANSVDLSDKGQEKLTPFEPDLFLMERLEETTGLIDEQEGVSYEDKLKLREEATSNFLDKNEKLHNIQQLLKSYALFEKDVDYVVQDNKVIIVDEFTGRLMPGRRFSDGLHQALEAKEDVRIEEASQTLATITLQNYFRMYDKLAGMTGTAITEEGEFMEIYKLPVVSIPTNRPVARIDHEDVIFLSKNEKYNAILSEIEYWHSQGKPVLVGTVTVEVSEIVSRLLRRKKIPHHVLNAKYHEQEAEIIKNAGLPGSVTIATNMAGRGTDIKLGQGVVVQDIKEYLTMAYKVSDDLPFGGHLDGLHVIGTERHESRRIDRQLRGRAGRQGDPGTSRFYLSLEDDLMRLFGSDRIAPMMMKLGLKENEAITHPWMTSAVEKAQKRVEMHNFEIRKQLLKYDEVMNQQRNVIYTYRQNVLKGYDLHEEILDMMRDAVTSLVYGQINPKDFPENWEYEGILFWLRKANINVTKEDFVTKQLDAEILIENISEILFATYKKREEEMGVEQMRELERRVLLSVVDEEWQEHLHEMDILKDGIGLRAYGNKDPLLEYKKESFNLFNGLIEKINERVTQQVFTTYLLTEQQMRSLLARAQTHHASTSAYGGGGDPQPEEDEKMPKIAPRRSEQKVGRNDPCPCGSGLKYKKCCGKNNEEEE